MKLKIVVLMFSVAIGFALPAQAQLGGGGLRANDNSSAEPARMHDPGVNREFMVDGQNPEGAPASPRAAEKPPDLSVGRKGGGVGLDLC
jgi:hypothetical protein